MNELTPPNGSGIPSGDTDSWATEEVRRRLLDLALSHLGEPYRWNGKGPNFWDCSGFVTGMMRKVGLPDWRYSHSSADLFREPLLEPVKLPHPMDLVFYAGEEPGSPIEHVMFVVGDGRVLGACGGGHTTLTLEDATRARAKVQFRSGIHYRKTFMGFRRIPIPTPKE